MGVPPEPLAGSILSQSRRLGCAQVTGMSSDIVLGCPSAGAVRQLNEALQRRRLSVVRSFDLLPAKVCSRSRGCPRHGTTDCDCQPVVPPVNGSSLHPFTVTEHSCGPSTSVELIEATPEPGGVDLRKRVRASLSDTFGARVKAAWP